MAPPANQARSLLLNALGISQAPFDSDVGIEAEAAEAMDAAMKGVAQRRMVFRKIAQQSPGLLTSKAISEYRELLVAGDQPIPDDAWAPIFLRYYVLLPSALPSASAERPRLQGTSYIR